MERISDQVACDLLCGRHFNLIHSLVDLDGLWLVANHFHVFANLLRQLFQHFLSKVSSGDTIVEFNKLDDVSDAAFALQVDQRVIVSVQDLHLSKLLSIAYADDDDGAG